MIPIAVFNYKSVVKEFTIFAPLKHGTRWLETTKPSSHYMLNGYSLDGVENKIDKSLHNVLFIPNEVPYNNSSLKVKKFKRTLNVNRPVFVYRDPYEAFVTSIITGLGVINNKWNGDPKTLDITIVGNGHFSPTIWQTILEMLEPLDNDSIEFVELRELSTYMRINTLSNFSYSVTDYSFEQDIPFGHTKDDIIQLCKEYHPILWDNFMIQIEKETTALNKLLDKFKWINKR